MCDGYYKSKNNIAVYLTTTGPGTTNLVTVVANAKIEQVPMLVITAQNSLDKSGKPALQDSTSNGVDTVSLLEICCKSSQLICHENQIGPMLTKAIINAYSPPYGPTHLSIATDILKRIINNRIIKNQTLTFNLGCDSINTEKVHNKLLHARTSVIFIGEHLEDTHELIVYATNQNIPVITCPMSRRHIASNQLVFGGSFGLAGHKSAGSLLEIFFFFIFTFTNDYGVHSH